MELSFTVGAMPYRSRRVASWALAVAACGATVAAAADFKQDASIPAQSAQSVTNLGFDHDKPGGLPRGWTAAITGGGTPKWSVVHDDTSPSGPNVLKQSGEVARSSFPLCFKSGSSLKDGFVEVRIKPIGGKIDQAGGLVWRARDKANYYVCRVNALEDNVVPYKVQNGKRSSLDIVGRAGGYGVDVKVASGEWHTLRIEFAGSRFKAFFDGRPLFELEDSTFSGAGMMGVWTKADSVTLFDDFRFGND